jgi:hypothetical protein
MRSRYAVLTLAIVLAAGSPAAGQSPSVEDVTSRAAQYVAQFFARFSNVVSEEKYLQDVMPVLRGGIIVGGRGGLSGGVPRNATDHRELKSDFLLVSLPDSTQTIPFRDTFEVDGRAVRDRQERLSKLFLGSNATALGQAKAITEESARYNIGNLQRTVNDPVMALSLLQAVHRSRFAFTLDKADPDSGPGIWIVEYNETARPTLVRGPQDRDMPMHGRFWIEAASGRVVKSEFVIQDPAVTARITTSFRTDDRFKVDVPQEMLEDYAFATTHITGQATYARFRQFGVNTDEQLTDDPPQAAP